jgi:thioredoxin reductase (NADPH)
MTIIHRRNEFRANVSNVNRLKANKVKTLLDYEIVKIHQHKLVCHKNNQTKLVTIPFDYVIVQYGQTVDTSGLKIFKNLNITNANRIPVDIAQMTNLNNIYAIGNICIYDGKPSSIICAHGEAAVAVRHILNKVRPYDKQPQK